MRRVQQVSSGSESLRYSKLLTAPAFEKRYKAQRAKFAEENVDLGSLWQRAIFSDENELSLGGPDEHKHYWRGSRKEKKCFQKGAPGGGPAMVWGAFSDLGASGLVAKKGGMNSLRCSKILEDQLAPMNALSHGGSAIFQQDSAPSALAIS